MDGNAKEQVASVIVFNKALNDRNIINSDQRLL